MNKKFKYLLLFLTCFILWIIATPTKVSADIKGIAVTPLVTDSDITDRFQIISKGGETRTLKVSISNFNSGSIDLVVAPTNATTSSDGKLVFTDVVKKGDYGLQDSFASMTKTKKVTIKSNQTKDLDFKVKLPDHKINGLIIGGFNVYENTSNYNGNANVPVWITGDNKAVGGILKAYNLTLGVQNYQPHVYVNLQNDQPGLMKNVVVHMTIKRQSWLDRFNLGPKKMVADLRYPKIAPNSKVPIDFNQNQTPIAPGTYKMKGVARSGKTVWNFHKTYKISQSDANKINSKSRNLIYDKTLTYILISGVLVTLIAFIFWGIWHQNRS
ncbi:WxL protein peptidoglycan domain-containing protein [Companilactobacillus kedongensis]|uniref:WxL protein peptidoglycan domain-containing protein n=1 Tax=Companilactobacillus kedongensis TaxID=2486004 RepID=UPI000F7A1C30|nr:DUF3324 domain-containing protein [Companilactobacillus kedongensis]